MIRVLPAAGFVALPLLLAATLAGLVVQASADPSGGARVELEVAGILPMPEGHSCVLVLRERGRSTLLPLVLSRQDPEELRDDLRARQTPGMVGEALHRLGARVKEVEIANTDDTRQAARVRLSQGGRQLEVQARPSESILLAVAAGAPILTTRQLLREAGLEPEDIRRAKEKLEGPARGPLRL